jgi:hypothetical protein
MTDNNLISTRNKHNISILLLKLSFHKDSRLKWTDEILSSRTTTKLVTDDELWRGLDHQMDEARALD